MKKIITIKSINNHKVINILGIKFKLKEKRKNSLKQSYQRIGKLLLPRYGRACKDENNNTVLGHQALHFFIEMTNRNMKILDIGCGENKVHTNLMRKNGLRPETCDIFGDCTYNENYENVIFPCETFDAIWCCHCLEHVFNIQDFLLKIKHDIKEGGILAITVPPLKHEITCGHINLFNAGLLLYRLVLAGFDCSDAKVAKYGYNISVILKIKKIKQLPKLKMTWDGDLELLQPYFPFDTYQNFDGDNIRVDWNYDLENLEDKYVESN